MPIQPTVFKNGVSTNSEGVANWFPYPDDALFHQLFDDFNHVDINNEWEHLFTGFGAGAFQGNGRGGILNMLNSPNIGDIHMIQTRANCFSPRELDNKRFYIRISLLSPDWINHGTLIGLADPGLGALTAANKFFFRSPPGTDAFTFLSERNGGSTWVSPILVTGIVPNQIFNLDMFLDEEDIGYFYVNGKLVHKEVIPADAIPDDTITPMIYGDNGGAVSQELYTDYFHIAEER
jgi:hypothetical protein